jgi:RNA polymerase sigma-70 factor, ECF subfamily
MGTGNPAGFPYNRGRTMTEKERIYAELLALRCRRKEKGAFEELVRTWERRLFYYIRRLVPDEQDAWDILQETWVGVIGGIGRLRDPSGLAAWLYSVARRRVLDHYRESYSRQTADEEEIGPIEDLPDLSPRPEDAERVHRALEQLSIPHREAITLHFLEGFSIDEIADIVGIAPGTVKSRLHYARRALRSVLEREA